MAFPPDFYDSVRTRLDSISALRKAWKAAEAAHGEMYDKSRVVQHTDPDTEKVVRYEGEKLRRCRASIAAEAAYHKACDELVEFYEAGQS